MQTRMFGNRQFDQVSAGFGIDLRAAAVARASVRHQPDIAVEPLRGRQRHRDVAVVRRIEGAAENDVRRRHQRLTARCRPAARQWRASGPS